ncbi:hypothetical protein BC936DRAFT_140260 [Jimgerdemannia flammicorona]|uniref:Uncharacterized protein n=1 Tax=Jimgerdemannia flammicorona TaxID=994334 RepID=A0A433AVP8_9FUNG|nr:hypothetical protein BC936DRAFT_140260 [Jimgerdemannia flammicorona]
MDCSRSPKGSMHASNCACSYDRSHLSRGVQGKPKQCKALQGGEKRVSSTSPTTRTSIANDTIEEP